MIRKQTIILIKIVAALHIFLTGSFYLARDQAGLYYQISSFVNSGFLHPSNFSILQISQVVILLHLATAYNVRIKLSKLFFFALVAFISRMINPNSDTLNPILGMPLLSNLSEYIFLLSILVLTSLPYNLIKDLFSGLLRYSARYAVIKAIALIILYLSGGSSVIFLNQPIIVPGFDTQVVFSLIASILFTSYLVTGKSSHLIYSIILFFSVIFSLVRSTTIPGILTIFLVMAFSIYKRIPIISKKVVVLSMVLIAFIPITFAIFPESKLIFVANRFAAIAVDKRLATDIAFSDTGHWEQTKETFLAVFKERPIWGIGYGKTGDRLFLEGQSSVIHNEYARVWAQHGLITFLFFLYILFLTIKRLLALAYHTNKFNFRNSIYSLTAGIFLLGYFFSGLVVAIDIFMHPKLQFIWLLLFIYLDSSSKVFVRTKPAY